MTLSRWKNIYNIVRRCWSAQISCDRCLRKIENVIEKKFKKKESERDKNEGESKRQRKGDKKISKL